MKTILRSIAILSIILTVPAQALDLSNYDSMYVRVTLPADFGDWRVGSFLTGVLITTYRGTNQFSHVGEMTDDVSKGILIEADLSKVRMRGASKLFTGVFSGKDSVEGQVRLIDIATGDVLADLGMSEASSAQTMFTASGSNIWAATEKFANSIIVWSGTTPEGFGQPTKWASKLDRSSPVSIMCTGFESNLHAPKSKYSYMNRSDTQVCDVLDENLTLAGVRVVDSSPTQIHLQVYVEALPVAGARTVDRVMILRWQITSNGTTLHDDIAAVRYRDKGGMGKKGFTRSRNAVTQKAIRKGISAFLPETVWPAESK